VKKYIVTLPEPLRNRLEAEAERSGLMWSEMVRMAVHLWLEDREKRAERVSRANRAKAPREKPMAAGRLPSAIRSSLDVDTEQPKSSGAA
jgi:Arc/MetJ-type ribon-helix-helix transcriptional regulator